MTKPVEAPSVDKTKDGVDFINIWVYGATELGRGLASFSYSPFIHPFFGAFNSLEGFYHYIGTDDDVKKRDKLRSLSGIKAKEYAKLLKRGHSKDFFSIIFNANFYKIEQNENLKKLIMESDLPFEHYYLWGPGKLVIFPKQHDRVVDDFQKIRLMLKNGERPDDLDYSEFAV